MTEQANDAHVAYYDGKPYTVQHFGHLFSSTSSEDLHASASGEKVVALAMIANGTAASVSLRDNSSPVGGMVSTGSGGSLPPYPYSPAGWAEGSAGRTMDVSVTSPGANGCWVSIPFIVVPG